LDVLCLVIALAFFAVAAMLAHGCDRL